MKITAGYNRETGKAIQLSFSYKMNEYSNVWMPKSQLKFIDKNEQGDCIVDIPTWLINKQTPSHTYRGLSSANAVANFITRTGGDIYCNA
tara:strand:+ start:194 stop:463 length:270 start_codon:yes stop_codon:yes gene_type:complete